MKIDSASSQQPLEQGYIHRTSIWIWGFLGISLIYILFDIIMGYGVSAFKVVGDPNSPASSTLIMGTNAYGQDNFIRMLHFLAVTLQFSVIVVGATVLFNHMFGSQLASISRRLRRNKLALVGFALLVILTILAMYADFIADYEFVVIKQDLSRTFMVPGSEHILGTDDIK